MKQLLSQIVATAIYWAPPLVGGIVDYVNQLVRGDKHWSLGEFCVHVGSAVFFGWLSGMAAQGLGYEAGLIGAAGGMGGFLGVRLADLVTYSLKKFMAPTAP